MQLIGTASRNLRKTRVTWSDLPRPSAAYRISADLRRGTVSRRLKQTGVVFVVLFAIGQLVRPERANPATDPHLTIQAHSGTTSELTAVLDRSCRDCHSNATVWPWYTQVAPLSWLMAHAVTEGRKAVNFSEWSGYSPSQQRTLLSVSCDDASTGRMPGAWTLIHRDARLSSHDVETICAAARSGGSLTKEDR
jgi:hypothetical protein